MQNLKKQARTASQDGRKGAKKEPWPHRVAKREPKRNPNSLKRPTFGIIVFKVHEFGKTFIPEMPPKFFKKRLFLEAASKVANGVSTAPARADRGSDPPEKQTKSKKIRPANQHISEIDLLRKMTQRIQPLGAKIPPIFQHIGPVSPNPSV